MKRRLVFCLGLIVFFVLVVVAISPWPNSPPPRYEQSVKIINGSFADLISFLNEDPPEEMENTCPPSKSPKGVAGKWGTFGWDTHLPDGRRVEVRPSEHPNYFQIKIFEGETLEISSSIRLPDDEKVFMGFPHMREIFWTGRCDGERYFFEPSPPSLPDGQGV